MSCAARHADSDGLMVEDEREEIINIPMSGVDVERALAMTLEAKSALS